MAAIGLFSRTLRGSVSSIGEDALIRLIRRWLGRASPRAPAGIGDDCAVLLPARRRELLTVDSVVHGIHIDDRIPPRAAGSKLFRRNLSDIAAMGGRPRAAVIALALDGRVSRAWLEEFYRGLARESRLWRVPVVGGDVAHLPGSFVATLALTGEAAGRVLTRAGSRARDWIYVTGALGRSLPTGHHYLFKPRLAEGAWLARRSEVRAMIDVSDGLAKDLAALTPRGASPAIYAAALPRRAGATAREALCDGEDYELAFSVAPGARRTAFEKAWRRAFPRTRLTCLGRFVRAGAVPPEAIALGNFRGYEHLR
ncbi:MAG TPA: thiamine-phosphate kinase [Opitutaceae bacterium]|nr:thiamine-phosphate kinase [Opitutaceae bacterium]